MSKHLSFYRTIKGAASLVLWILIGERRQVGMKEMAHLSGYNREALTEAFNVLGPDGLGIVHVGIWAHNEKFVCLLDGYQMQLPAVGLIDIWQATTTDSLNLESSFKGLKSLNSSSRDQMLENPATSPQLPENPATSAQMLENPATGAAPDRRLNRFQMLENPATSQGQMLENPATEQNPDFDECLKMAKKCGIGNPSAGKIANLRHPETGAWMTPEHIENCVKTLCRPKEKIGLAIHRLLNWECPQMIEVEEELHGERVTRLVAEFMQRTR